MAAYRVLVVDDNHEVRRMVTASIKTLGAEIDVLDVPSAEEALFLSSSLPLDLVVLDFRLPGMTGLDLVTRLRKRRPEAKIILVTGVEDAATRQQVVQAGVEAYFFKPIEIDRFLEAVKHCLWADQAAPVQSSAATLSTEPVTPASQVEASAMAPLQPGYAVPAGLMPTIDERLTSLKKQLKAVSVLLVNDTGEVMEVVGNPSQLTSGSALLTALMHAFRASRQVSQALNRGASTSLEYFALQRQCLYMVPVGLSHALFAITSGYFEPDKLGAIDRYFQLAARDLQAIFAGIAADEQARQDEKDKLQTGLPAEVPVDQETLAGVEKIFAGEVKNLSQEGAETFWDSVGDKDAQQGARGKDILSYDQAHDLGLAPGEDKPA